MRRLREKATDPAQYDHPAMDWIAEGYADSSSRVFFKEFLEPLLGNLSGQRVLDIGCGTGWLSKVVQQHGAEDYIGIDPSTNNIAAAQLFYPGTRFKNTRLEDFETTEKFDLITCIMTTEHIDDLVAAFQSWSRMLLPGGRVVIIAGSVGAFVKPRFDYELTLEKASPDETIVHTHRPSLKVDTTDIIRPVSFFEQAAREAGLEMTSVTPMLPTERFVELAPRYGQYKNDPVFELMTFEKSDKKQGEL